MKLNVSSTILWLGVLLSASGIVFFFAYNWQDMHKFLKLFTIWVIIFSSVVIYLRADSSVVAHNKDIRTLLEESELEVEFTTKKYLKPIKYNKFIVLDREYGVSVLWD